MKLGGILRMDDTKNTIKSYILSEFLPGEDPALLTDSTPLVTGVILDSLATLKLVEFLQEKFQIEIEPYEMSAENLDTLPDITQLVHSKL
jgi:acyl carrier protein